MIKSLVVYRDGGSIELRGADDFGDYIIWRDTPFKGKNSELKYNGIKVLPGDSLSKKILDHLNFWHSQLSDSDRDGILLVEKQHSSRKDPFKHGKYLVDLYIINNLRNYVMQNYGLSSDHPNQQ